MHILSNPFCEVDEYGVGIYLSCERVVSLWCHNTDVETHKSLDKPS